MDSHQKFYEAMCARDHRFDGKFFVGVKTTGIYCRPICPAKPLRKNVEFFKTHHEAERAGYRPCLRCRPESAPLSPAWIGTSAIVQRALKTLHQQGTIELDENEFAGLFGVSARHLRRLFIKEIGKTPKQICFENRLNIARKCIVETNLPMADVAFASGFKSIRRFNDAFKDRFKQSPSKIRRTPLSAESSLTFSLPYRPPFNYEALLNHYRSHQMASLEWFDDKKMHRIIEFNDKIGQVTISNDADRSRLLLEIDFPDTSVIYKVISRVRALFDLDCDPVIIANTLENNSRCKNILKKHAGIRLPSGWDPYEVAVATILGQLVSVERGRQLVCDLVEMLGRKTNLQINGSSVKLFPSPEAVAAADLSHLRTTAIRKNALKVFSQALATGEISLQPTQDIQNFFDQVLRIPGIGPWTAHYMALKCLRHTDAFPETDLILSRAVTLHSKETITQMSPWRGYAAALFWREYA